MFLVGYPRWTPEEDDALRRWPAERPLRELAQRLGRSYLATRNRYHRVVGLRRPSRRRSSSPGGAVSPESPQRLEDFFRLAVMIQRLRSQRALRGPLAGPDWIGVLLRAASEFARRCRRLGQEPELVDLEQALLRQRSLRPAATEPEHPGSRARRYQN